MKTIQIESGFHIIIRDADTNQLTLCVEGSWATREEAEDFANAEVGMDWVVVFINSDKQ